MKIETIDLHYQNVPHAIAAYLVIGPEGPVLVETGPGSTLPTLITGLAQYGYAPEAVKHILVTHIHFDHAGCSGWWAQQGAQIYVHHNGARHLIDPSRLIASATRIYGDKMDVLWGEILPAPAERVTSIYDGDTIEAAGLTFTALDTPGHARHHHVFRLGDAAFVGDAAGIKLPGCPLMGLPAPPPEFDREAWQETIRQLRGEDVATIYPTHFGPTPNNSAHWDDLSGLVDNATEFIRERMDAGMSREAIGQAYQVWNRNRAVAAGLSQEMMHQYMTANPLEMSVDGIMRYWKKKQRQEN